MSHPFLKLQLCRGVKEMSECQNAPPGTSNSRNRLPGTNGSHVAGLDDGWIAAADVPFGTGNEEIVSLPEPDGVVGTAVRLWLTQPLCCSTVASVHELFVFDPSGRSLDPSRAEASHEDDSLRNSASFAIDRDRGTFWSSGGSSAAVEWIAVTFPAPVRVKSVKIQWGDYPVTYRIDVRGACHPTRAMAARGVSDCSPMRPRKRAYEVVVRTTSASLMRAGVVDSLRRLRAQLHMHARLTLLVDATICAGLGCNASWLAADLRLPVFTYRARDLAARWPRVKWPVMGIDKPPEFWASAGESERWLACWLASRMADRLDALPRLPWPRPRGRSGVGGGVNGGGVNESQQPLSLEPLDVARGSLVAVPFLVHEPSLVLWLERRGSDGGGGGGGGDGGSGTSRERDVWVLEDDVIFSGDASLFFERHAASVHADLISEFQPWKTDCDAALTDELTGAVRAGWGGTSAAVLRRPCMPPTKKYDMAGASGDSRQLWPVHRWYAIHGCTLAP